VNFKSLQVCSCFSGRSELFDKNELRQGSKWTVDIYKKWTSKKVFFSSVLQTRELLFDGHMNFQNFW
jgi:hypothetical protein